MVSKFGMITLRSFYYLNEHPQKPGLRRACVWGIGAGSATPGVVGAREPACR